MKNFDENIPIYLQVREKIENAIIKGYYQTDDMLPSIRTIAKEFSINPLTVSNAISELISEGIIYKKRGIGMFVSIAANEKLIIRKKKLFLKKELPKIILKGIDLKISKSTIINIISETFISQSIKENKNGID